jgi:hypothetical protein
MFARLFAAAAVLFVAACSQPAPAPDEDRAAHAGDTGEAAPANPDAAALGGAPMEGVWSHNGDGATVSAGFGAPESEYLFIVVCEGGTGQVRVDYEHELYPDQDTTLRLITETATVELPARSFNEGLPTVSAQVAGGDARLAALAARQERFAVEVAGEISVLPWNEAIALTLAGCA